MNASTIVSATVLLAAGAGMNQRASAEVVLGPAPNGMTTLAVLPGAAGVAVSPSQWFSGENGRSYFTYWSGDTLRYSVALPGSSQAWRLGVTAMNVSGPLPGSYHDFNVRVSVGSQIVGTLLVPASDTNWNTAWIDLGMRQGPTDVSLTWLNDSYQAGVYDANISYGGLQFASLSIPTPGTGSLAMAAFGLLAIRSRRPRT